MEFFRNWIIAFAFFACAVTLQALPKSQFLSKNSNIDTGSGNAVASGSASYVSDPPTTIASTTGKPSSVSPGRSNTTQCGTKVTAGRIVGGTKAPLGEWPWLVGVSFCSDCYAGCGGTIIGKKWIVTAAHCFEDMKPLQPETVYIEAGVVNQDDGSDFKQSFRCKKIHMHPNYNVAERFDLDVAVLELDKEVKYNDYVRPLCLNEEELNVGQKCTVTGFGTTQNGDSSVYLKQALMPIVSQDTCEQVYGDGLTGNMICAGYPQGGTDSCQGDSGGPLSCYDVNKSRFVLGGIISFGDGCAEPNQYGVYTKVKQVVKWVKSVTNAI